MDVLNSPKDVVVGLAVDEAIQRLGYLNDSARPFLIAAVQDGSGIHPRALCTAHRKEGEQLTRDELKALGLRANAFMSRQARAEITDKVWPSLCKRTRKRFSELFSPSPDGGRSETTP